MHPLRGAGLAHGRGRAVRMRAREPPLRSACPRAQARLRLAGARCGAHLLRRQNPRARALGSRAQTIRLRTARACDMRATFFLFHASLAPCSAASSASSRSGLAKKPASIGAVSTQCIELRSTLSPAATRLQRTVEAGVGALLVLLLEHVGAKCEDDEVVPGRVLRLPCAKEPRRLKPIHPARVHGAALMSTAHARPNNGAALMRTAHARPNTSANAPWHGQVHENEVERLAARAVAVGHQAHSHIAVVCGAHLDAALQLQQLAAQLPIQAVVIDKQRAQPPAVALRNDIAARSGWSTNAAARTARRAERRAERRRARQKLPRRAGRILRWRLQHLHGRHSDGEARTLSRLALHADAAVHRLAEALADVQPQAGASTTVARAAHVRLEDARTLLLQ
jgi:hypothetical protein